MSTMQHDIRSPLLSTPKYNISVSSVHPKLDQALEKANKILLSKGYPLDKEYTARNVFGNFIAKNSVDEISHGVLRDIVSTNLMKPLKDGAYPSLGAFRVEDAHKFSYDQIRKIGLILGRVSQNLYGHRLDNILFDIVEGPLKGVDETPLIFSSNLPSGLSYGPIRRVKVILSIDSKSSSRELEQHLNVLLREVRNQAEQVLDEYDDVVEQLKDNAGVAKVMTELTIDARELGNVLGDESRKSIVDLAKGYAHAQWIALKLSDKSGEIRIAPGLFPLVEVPLKSLSRYSPEELKIQFNRAVSKQNRSRVWHKRSKYLEQNGITQLELSLGFLKDFRSDFWQGQEKPLVTGIKSINARKYVEPSSDALEREFQIAAAGSKFDSLSLVSIPVTEEEKAVAQELNKLASVRAVEGRNVLVLTDDEESPQRLEQRFYSKSVHNYLEKYSNSLEVIRLTDEQDPDEATNIVLEAIKTLPSPRTVIYVAHGDPEGLGIGPIKIDYHAFADALATEPENGWADENVPNNIVINPACYSSDFGGKLIQRLSEIDRSLGDDLIQITSAPSSLASRNEFTDPDNNDFWQKGLALREKSPTIGDVLDQRKQLASYESRDVNYDFPRILNTWFFENTQSKASRKTHDPVFVMKSINGQVHKIAAVSNYNETTER